MKKTIALMMTAAMLLLSACGSTPSTAPTESPSPAPAAQAEPTPESTAVPENTATEIPTLPENEEEKTAEDMAEPSTPAEEDSEEFWDSTEFLSMGTVEGKTYRNEALGVGCTLGEDWEFADEDYIRELNQWGQDNLSEDVQDLIRKTERITDMLAMSGTGTENVNVQIQNMHRLYGRLLSEKAIVDSTIEAMQSSDMLQGAGYEEAEITGITLTFLGEEHSGIYITGTAYGQPIFQKEVLLRHGGYMAVITATSFLEDNTDEILSRFFAL